VPPDVVGGRRRTESFAVKLTIYHNPRCSKSRETLQLLQDAGVEPKVVEYLKSPPAAPELDAICRKLGIEPQELIRFKEPEAKALGIAKGDTRSRAEWLRLIVDHPVLMERPIVVAPAAARIGRPPEAVRDLLA
jgi:arsenate reductase